MGTLRGNVRNLLAVQGIQPLGRGQVFYVDSVNGNSSYGGTTPDYPKATLTQALALCTTGRGDVIIVMPGHVETISGAAGIAIAKANVRIVGLGAGSSRPTFTWSATASTWTVTAANVTIENILCVVSIDSVVNGFAVSAANCTFNRVDFAETASKQMLIFIGTTAAADGLTIRNCHHVQVAAGSAKWIDLVGVDNCRIEDNLLHVNATTHVIGGTTTASLNVNIVRNLIVNAADAGSIVLLASSTGIVAYNGVGSGKSAIAGSVALANAYGVNNYAVNTVNTSGILDPVADT